MKLAAYIRVSKVAGRDGDAFHSPGQQREAIAAAAHLAGGVIVREFVDLDESGGTMDRPGLKEMLAFVDAGHADGIIVARLDRFARNADAIEMIDRLEQTGRKFISAAERFDTSTPVGEFALGMMLLVARMQRRQIADNWKDIERRIIERGVHPVIPFGYQRGPDGPLELSAQADVVRRIFQLRRDGLNLAQIIAALDGTLTPSQVEAERLGHDRAAAAWTKQTVRSILRNRAYLGEAFKGDLVKRDAHPAIVTAQEFADAQTWEGPRGRGTEPALLAGLVRCAGCGYLMGRSTSRGVVRYGCPRSTGTGLCPSPTTATGHAVDEHVTAAFLDRYGTVAVVGAHDDRETRASAAVVERAGREVEAWRDDVEMREAIGAEHYRAGLVARARALEDAERAHAATVRANQTLTVEASAWESFSTPERRTLLRAGIDEVVLSRAASTRTPVADRCVIRWAGELDDDAVARPVAGRP